MSRRALGILAVSLVVVATVVAGVAIFAARQRAREHSGAEDAARRRTMMMVLSNEDYWQIDPAALDPVALSDLPTNTTLPADWRPVPLNGREIWLPAGVEVGESNSPETGRPRLILGQWPGRDDSLWIEWRPERHDASDFSSLRAALAGSELTYEQVVTGGASELEALLRVYRLRGRDIEVASESEWRDVFRLVFLKDRRNPPRRHVTTPSHHFLFKQDVDLEFAQTEVFDRSGKLLGVLHVGRPESLAALGSSFADPRLLAVLFEGPGALAGSPTTAPNPTTSPG